MTEQSSSSGLKYHALTVQFGEDFSGNQEITSKQISDWGHARGVDHPTGWSDTDYARWIVDKLRTACDRDGMGEDAFRLVSKNPRIWAKEMITVDTLALIYDDAIRKANGAVANGSFRNLKASGVLMQRALSPQQTAIVKYMAPRVYDRLANMLVENRKDFEAISQALAFAQQEQFPPLKDSTE